MNRHSGLGLRFLKLLALAALFGTAISVVAHSLGNRVVDSLVNNTDFRAARAEERTNSLQGFIERHQLQATDSKRLVEWCQQQPLILMEVYRNGKLIFSSAYFEEDTLYEKEVDANFYDWYTYHAITFADGEAELLLLCDETYQCRAWVNIAAVFAGATFFIFVFLRGVRQVASYICELNAEVQVMEGGDLHHPVTVRGKDELGMLAEGLESMRRSFAEQRMSETLSLQANQSLITGLSHDLRTPLTKIMLYVEILRNGKYQDKRQVREYLARIGEKVEQLRALSEDILRYSLTAADDLDATVVALEMDEALKHPLAEMCEFLQQRGYEVINESTLPAQRIRICAPLLRRLFDNLASNIDKYAERCEPVRIALVQDEHVLGISVSNAVGDASTSEGAGIGLLNVEYMMLRMGGSYQVVRSSDAFSVILLFQRE